MLVSTKYKQQNIPKIHYLDGYDLQMIQKPSNQLQKEQIKRRRTLFCLYYIVDCTIHRQDIDNKLFQNQRLWVTVIFRFFILEGIILVSCYQFKLSNSNKFQSYYQFTWRKRYFYSSIKNKAQAYLVVGYNVRFRPYVLKSKINSLIQN